VGVKRYAGAKGKADKLYSLIIRSIGECEKCGYMCDCPNKPFTHTTGCKLTTSHIISRRYSATRTLEANGQCLCFSCHRRFTDFPREFSHWITESIGSEAYEELRERAETLTKVDWEAEAKRLQERFKEITT